MEELEPFNWVYDWDEAFLQNLDEPAYFPDADGEWSEDEHGWRGVRPVRLSTKTGRPASFGGGECGALPCTGPLRAVSPERFSPADDDRPSLLTETTLAGTCAVG